MSDLTPVQTAVFEAALKSSEYAVVELLRFIPMNPMQRYMLVNALVSMQLGTVRQVVQYSANERADVARITEEQLMKFMQDLPFPE